MQTTGDGGFLVFTSYGQLSAGDTDTAQDVYRYDAESGALDRVSVGEDGYDANGNNDAFNANRFPPGIWAGAEGRTSWIAARSAKMVRGSCSRRPSRFRPMRRTV